MIKNIIIKILNKIKKVLNFFIQHTIPSLPAKKKNYIYPYDRWQEEVQKESYEHFKKHFHNVLWIKKKNLIEFTVKKSLENDPNQEKLYLEFGVFTGGTINRISKLVKKVTGFDSFRGLNETWAGNEKDKGHFDLKGKPPKVNSNVELEIGLIQDTLNPFLLRNNDKKINFLHLDVDTYETTDFILKNIKKNLANNCTILFDDFWYCSGWSVNIYKAFQENFNEDEYKYIAFPPDGKLAVVQLNLK